MFGLIYLDELYENSERDIQKTNSMVKRWFEKKYASNSSFKLGNLVLKWDEDRAKPGSHRKFDSFWSGIYIITKEI